MTSSTTMPSPDARHPTAGSHWRSYAAYWRLLGSPLRPGAEDVRLYRELLAEHFRPVHCERSRVLMLGVTPELAGLDWPGDVEVVATERVASTIGALWPGNTAHKRAICTDWLRLPFADSRFDLAIGDGCLVAIGARGAQGELIAAAGRALRRGGFLCLRLFCRPEPGESVDAVFASLQQGDIGGFHAFKWRLAMALQGRGEDVAVADIWRVWHAAEIDRDELAQGRGWHRAVIDTIDAYRDSPMRYRFAGYDSLVSEFEAAGFHLLAVRQGNYELSERCPIVMLRRGDEAIAVPSGAMHP